MSDSIIKTGEMENVWSTITTLSEALKNQAEAFIKLSQIVTSQNARLAELEKKHGEEE